MGVGVGVAVIELAAAAFTVTLTESFFPATDAYMVAVPAALAVTLPLEDTVATETLLDDQLTFFWFPEQIRF